MFKEPNGEERFDKIVPGNDELTHLSEGNLREAVEEAEANMYVSPEDFVRTAHLDINPKNPLLTRLRELHPNKTDEELREMIEDGFEPEEDPLIAELKRHFPGLSDEAIKRIMGESLGGPEDLPKEDEI
jgi:hypothetical protein